MALSVKQAVCELQDIQNIFFIHSELNNLLKRAPVGLCREDGKRFDGIVMIPWWQIYNLGRDLHRHLRFEQYQ